MRVIVILQMAEALLVIMDWTFLNSSENGSKSCSPGGVQRRFRRQETCLHSGKITRGWWGGEKKERTDKVREGFREGLTLGLRRQGSQV